MLERILLHVPAVIILACVLFCVFPVWPTASIAIAALLFVAFKDWLSSSKENELRAIREDIKKIQSQIESIQISRTIGR